MTTKRLGALALAGLALAALACSPKEDTAVGSDTSRLTSTTTEAPTVVTEASADLVPVAEIVVTTVAPTTVATTMAPTTMAPTTVAPTTVAPTTVAPTTVAPIVVPPTIAPVEALMPNVVCMNLQDAQDLIQEQGVFLSLSQDATGQGRMQILDANWQVVNQFPAVGTPIDEGDAMLDVVKYGESSPCS